MDALRPLLNGDAERLPGCIPTQSVGTIWIFVERT